MVIRFIVLINFKKVEMYVRELDVDYTHNKFQKISLFLCYLAQYRRKGMTPFFTCNFADIQICRRKRMTCLESWGDSVLEHLLFMQKYCFKI